MKKIFAGLIALTFCLANAQAQDSTLGQKIKRDTKKTGHAIGKEAKKVGKKTSEIAAKGAAKVVDKTYKGKAGPNGETVYINKDSRYYYVDKKGHRKYVTESELTDKP